VGCDSTFALGQCLAAILVWNSQPEQNLGQSSPSIIKKYIKNIHINTKLDRILCSEILTHSSRIE
jgi:hypothetical protein